MRIAKLIAENVKCWEGRHEWTFGDIVVISGSNEAGKTSMLQLVTGLFGPANERMLRPGAAEGLIEATLVEDDETWVVSRRFEPGKVSSPSVKSSKTGRLGASATYLKSIVDLVSLDIIATAMRATEKRQAEILLETLPLDLPANSIEAAVGDVGTAAIVRNAHKLPALDAIASVYDDIEQRRRDVNRDAKARRAQAEGLRETIPAGAKGAAASATDWIFEQRRLSQKLQERIDARAAAMLEAEREAGKRRDAINARFRILEVEIDNEAEKEIEVIRDRQREKHRDLNNQGKIVFDEARAAHQKRLAEIEAEFRPEHDRLTAEHARARELASQQDGIAKTKALAERTEFEAAQLQDQAAAMTKALDNLKALRAGMLEKLPIKGLEVKGGVIYLDGVCLSERNTAAQGLFWLKIAARRAAELGVCVIDNCELFDEENFSMILRNAPKRIQWFFGRRTEGPLSIVTVDVESEVVA